MAWVVTSWYQFAGDATVEGEGKEHHGIEAIRAWRSEVPRVTYPVHEVRRNDGGYDAATDIIGPTGVGQICEITTQLRCEAGQRQHPGARTGLAHMVGVGAVCLVHVLRKDPAV